MTGMRWTAASFEVSHFLGLLLQNRCMLNLLCIYFFLTVSFRRPNSSSSASFWHITGFIHSFQQQPICPNVLNVACFYDCSNFLGSNRLLLHAVHFPGQYNVFVISSESSSRSACYIVFRSSLNQARIVWPVIKSNKTILSLLEQSKMNVKMNSLP